MNFHPPVYVGNLGDDNHCLQAAALMVLKTLGKKTTWAEIDKETDFQEDHYTWAPCAAMAIRESIPDTQLLGHFDYPRFAQEGEDYLKALWSPEMLAQQKAHATPDFAKERTQAQAMLDKGLYTQSNLLAADITGLLKTHLAIVTVNAPALYGGVGQVGHFVLAFGSDSKHVWIHDPGLPPRSTQKVPIGNFDSAFPRQAIMVPNHSFEFGLHYTPHAQCYCGSGKKFKDCHIAYD